MSKEVVKREKKEMLNNHRIKPKQANFLEELKNFTNKPIPIVDRIEYNTIGVKIDDNNIVELGLYDCELIALPNSISNLKSLKKLYVGQNKLTILPDSIIQLTSLQILDFRNNKLKTLPQAIGNLKSLKKLYLGQNQLTILPDSITNLELLQILDLGGHIMLDCNNLTVLPESIGNLKSLQMLDLSNNKIESLPESITKLNLLQSLNLDCNKLVALPQAIGNLKSLEFLNLNSNELAILPNSIGNLKMLRFLNVRNNHLKTLPESIWRCKNLETLELSRNPWENEWQGIDKYSITSVLELCRQIAPINIFISYSKEDQEKYFVNDIKKDLEKRTEIFEVYISGDNKIPESQILIFIGTNKSKTSENCLYELELAFTYDIEIIPIKGIDINWGDLNQIKMKKDVYTSLDLANKIGFEFNGEREKVKEFCNELYEYIKKCKRKVNLFDALEKKLAKTKENIINIIEKLIESEEFREYLKVNLIQIKQLFKELKNGQISTPEYIFRCGQILNSKSKNS